MLFPNRLLTLTTLLLTILPTFNCRQLVFSLHIKCPLETTWWCLKHRIYEQDPIYHDFVGGETTCQNGGNARSVIRTDETSDGLFNHYFELFADFKHNCTENGSWKKWKTQHFGSIEIEGKPLEFVYGYPGE